MCLDYNNYCVALFSQEVSDEVDFGQSLRALKVPPHSRVIARISWLPAKIYVTGLSDACDECIAHTALMHLLYNALSDVV